MARKYRNTVNKETLGTYSYKSTNEVPFNNYVKARDQSQQAIQDSIANNSLTIISGPAGSGKTLLCIQSMYNLLITKRIEKILIIRLITETCDEDLGALPGEKDDKMLPFFMPIYDNLSVFLPKYEIDRLIENKLIECIPVSHCRGRSFNNVGVIVEETQNLSAHMALTVATRIGKNCHMAFNGDESQVDIKGRTGLPYIIQLVYGLEDTNVIRLTSKHIQRHPLVKEIIKRAEQAS